MTFPAALDTANDLLVAVNSWAGLTTGAITDLSTTIPVTSTSGLQATNGLVAIDNEVIAYSTLSGSALLGCTRGFDGTVAAAHSAGAAVEQRIVAAHHNRLASAILAIENALGVNPQGSYATVATALAALAPMMINKSSSTTNWSFSHTTGRLLSLQCWVWNGTNYSKLADTAFTATQELVAAPGTSNVVITLSSAQVGYVLAR